MNVNRIVEYEKESEDYILKKDIKKIIKDIHENRIRDLEGGMAKLILEKDRLQNEIHNLKEEIKLDKENKKIEQENWLILIKNLETRLDEEIANRKKMEQDLLEIQEKNKCLDIEKQAGKVQENAVFDGNDKVQIRDQETFNFNRRYLKCIPEALNERELEYEIKERRARKKNLFIRGTRTVGKGIKEEIEKLFYDNVGIPVYINKIKPIEGGIVVELESFKNKIEILKRRKYLERFNVIIEDDYTQREKEVRNWLEMVKKEEEENGIEVKMGYMKLLVDGEWYKWDDKRGAAVRSENYFRGAEEGRIVNNEEGQGAPAEEDEH